MTASAAALHRLARQIEGPVVRSGGAGFALACGDIGSRRGARPVAVVFPFCVGDVVRCVGWTAEVGLRLAVRETGDGIDAQAAADDLLLIDLSALNHIEVDAAARTLQAGGGTLWRDLEAVAALHGLAVPEVPLCAGGRSARGGAASPPVGPRFNALIDVQVVLADGRVVRADGTDHAHLVRVWRAGGVLTRLRLQAPLQVETGTGIAIPGHDRRADSQSRGAIASLWPPARPP